MLQYEINTLNALTHYLQIKCKIDNLDTSQLKVSLPLWRPGRYEAAEYVKNIRNFRAKDHEGNALAAHNISKNVWSISNHSSSEKIIVEYEYFAFQLDAGGSYIDDQLWLINFINCLVTPEGRQQEQCSVKIDLPRYFSVACTLPFKDNLISAANYDELVDKPLLASKDLTSYHYEASSIPFTIWSAGEAPVALQELVPAFKAFSESQLETFESIPFNKYYFLNVFLPYRYYHGVEHSDNTVIVLGVDDPEHDKQKFIDDLLGVSSHELFHTWNIKKIRPKEMLPYNFDQQVIFNTGFVAEGFTTYYGDLFLCRGGVWNIERYLEELNIFLKRHYRNTGRFTTSLIESSDNLWVDGYKPGPPNHKVSIYVKGALVAFLLDKRLRLATGHKKSLDDLMQWLDKDFVETGYTVYDIQQIAERIGNEDYTEFFNKYVFGTEPLDVELESNIKNFGLQLVSVEAENPLERHFGIVTELKEDTLRVENIFPNSIGEFYFSIGDFILSINDKKPADSIEELKMSPDTIQFVVNRLGRKFDFELNKPEETYFSHFKIILLNDITAEQELALNNWLNKKSRY